MIIKDKSNKNKFWWQFVVPLLFLLAGLNLIYSIDSFEFDPDEGINLMKAFLVNNDYQLYTDIWNDQPPLLTNFLAWSFKIFEPNVNFCRSLILMFSVILLWENWLILYLLGGIDCAFLGSLFLIISPDYLKLSISVMVGLPCLTLALGAFLSIILWHSTHKNRWLIVSAILLSLSVLTKLFTLFLAPIIVVGIFLDRAFSKLSTWQKKLQPTALWSVIFISFTWVLLCLLVGINNLHFLIEDHTSARTIAAFQDLSLKDYLQTDYKVFLAGFGCWGIAIAYRRQQWQIFYFVAWLLTAYLLLQQHRPVWYHQMLILHIPAIIVAGYAMGEIVAKIRVRGLRFVFKQRIPLVLISVAIFISSILLVGEQTKTTFRAIQFWRDSYGNNLVSPNLEYQFLSEIAQANYQTKWMVTDSPMFAFRAGVLVPPSTAVLSRKQIETGNITDKQLRRVITKYQPEQVFFRRFEWAGVTDFLNQNYRVKRQEQNFRLYERLDKK